MELQAILSGDIEPTLPPNVREGLLNVILAWANLDMATAFFVASVKGLNPDEGAEKFGRSEIADKLKKAANALEEQDNYPLAARVRKIADAYPQKALFRRRIAHTKCAGVIRSKPDRIIFLPFEREGPPGHLAIEVYDLEVMIEVAEWAKDAHDFF